MNTICALALTICAAPAHAACNWAEAKKDIVNILDGDAVRGEEFRKAAKAGRDTLDTIEKIVEPAARDRIRDCSYQAAEYLTQRGFPPLH